MSCWTDGVMRSSTGFGKTPSTTIKTTTGTRTHCSCGVAPDLAHLQHFHGFPDGHASVCPTSAQDKNGDGVIDLMETEATAGTTMVPFTADPVSMAIVVNTYPKASANGTYHYRKTVSLSALETAFGTKYTCLLYTSP